MIGSTAMPRAQAGVGVLGPKSAMLFGFRMTVRLVAGCALVAFCTAAPACKKKDSAGVQADGASAKPPVVKRKSKEQAAVGPQAARGAWAEPAPVAATASVDERAAAAVPVPLAPTAAVAPMPDLPPPPPSLAMGGATPNDPSALPGRPARVGPNPLGGADPGAAAAPVPPDRPQIVLEPAPPAGAAAAPVPVIVAASPVAAAPESLGGPREHAEPALDITGYLSAADVERVVGNKAKLRRQDLPGTAPSATYNAIYFGPEKGDGFGVALQVWRDANLAESRTRFNTMRNTYSNVAPTNKVAEQGFRAYFNGVVTLVFANVRRPMVASVSCSTKVCTADQLIEFAHRASERLQ
ncbi:MAG: hypothetical protein EXR77_01670 [Myxococcales bacterium]|nr:hypothetical protein [Myxococcales bacterium]